MLTQPAFKSKKPRDINRPKQNKFIHGGLICFGLVVVTNSVSEHQDREWLPSQDKYRTVMECLRQVSKIAFGLKELFWEGRQTELPQIGLTPAEEL